MSSILSLKLIARVATSKFNPQLSKDLVLAELLLGISKSPTPQPHSGISLLHPIKFITTELIALRAKSNKN